jgi:hypothetical protein
MGFFALSGEIAGTFSSYRIESSAHFAAHGVAAHSSIVSKLRCGEGGN